MLNPKSFAPNSKILATPLLNISALNCSWNNDNVSSKSIAVNGNKTCVPNCYKRGINESPRGDSLCHNDVIMTWTNVDTVLLELCV